MSVRQSDTQICFHSDFHMASVHLSIYSPLQVQWQWLRPVPTVKCHAGQFQWLASWLNHRSAPRTPFSHLFSALKGAVLSTRLNHCELLNREWISCSTPGSSRVTKLHMKSDASCCLAASTSGLVTKHWSIQGRHHSPQMLSCESGVAVFNPVVRHDKTKPAVT